MTKIYRMSAGFLQAYMFAQDEKNLDPEKIFKRLSLEMGGDGKTITKKQFDDYISKAESGDISVDKNRLKALKQIQKNWKTIAGDDDTLTYDEMKKYAVLLMSTVNGSFESIEIEDSKSGDSVYDFLMKCLNNKDKKDVTKEDLKTLFKKILSDDSILNSSDDDSDKSGLTSDLADCITNMLANFSSSSTIETVV